MPISTADQQSSTVENYLKQLYLLQQKQGDELVPTGHLARSLNVTPGTATIMVKSLADGGLVDYESRAGVRLSVDGRRVALSVLRRHRLVELFLVNVLGLDWSEVHDEAEVLEHAVSEKVLDRIDEMLGFPVFDPHGDPIPDAAGQIKRRDVQSLDECQPGDQVQVARIENQDADFLRFIDEKQLAPGAKLTISERDTLADSITLQRPEGDTIVIGMTAARKISVTSDR